jgi:hypothetical protein
LEGNKTYVRFACKRTKNEKFIQKRKSSWCDEEGSENFDGKGKEKMILTFGYKKVKNEKN